MERRQSGPMFGRKHSSGDLQSRLKTRKLLGVGETDDGDVHRSKLSQILGHSEQLFVKFPKGLRVWQCILAMVFTLMSLWALLLPQRVITTSGSDSDAMQLIVTVRLYGAGMLSVSACLWAIANSNDKMVIKFSLAAAMLYFVTQSFVTYIGSWYGFNGFSFDSGGLFSFLRFVLVSVTLYYILTLTDSLVTIRRHLRCLRQEDTNCTAPLSPRLTGSRHDFQTMSKEKPAVEKKYD